MQVAAEWRGTRCPAHINKHKTWFWKNCELFSQTQNNYPIRSRGGCVLLSSPRDTVSRRIQISQRFYSPKMKKCYPKKVEGLLQKHFENRISKTHIWPVYEHFFRNCKKQLQFSIGHERQRLWRNCKPFPIRIWNFTNAEWEANVREKESKMFTNFLGPWSPKSRHSTVRGKGVEKIHNIFFYNCSEI